jgi:hypothetical protein
MDLSWGNSQHAQTRAFWPQTSGLATVGPWSLEHLWSLLEEPTPVAFFHTPYLSSCPPVNWSTYHTCHFCHSPHTG